MKRNNLNILIGRIGDEFIFLESVFKDKDFMGATGFSIRPVPRREEAERMDPDNAKESLEDIWKQIVADGRTEEGLDQWVESVLEEQGRDAIFDQSFGQSHSVACEQFNAELSPDHSKDEEADFCECNSCGRMFCKDGCHGTKWADFDKLYCDKKTLALIAKYEKYTMAQEEKMRSK